MIKCVFYKLFNFVKLSFVFLENANEITHKKNV